MDRGTDTTGPRPRQGYRSTRTTMSGSAAAGSPTVRFSSSRTTAASSGRSESRRPPRGTAGTGRGGRGRGGAGTGAAASRQQPRPHHLRRTSRNRVRCGGESRVRRRRLPQSAHRGGEPRERRHREDVGRVRCQARRRRHRHVFRRRATVEAVPRAGLRAHGGGLLGTVCRVRPRQRPHPALP